MRVRIAELRKERGMTQDDLAQAIGMSRAFVAHIEIGTRQLSPRKQKTIADALGVDPTELIDFDAPDPADERRLIEAFRAASPDQRRAWLQMADVLSAGADKQDG
ncbi:helix-turn-helix transcriptional regulator [Lutimaribacter marinistellae]|uniref:Helix-turn-helix transcriptional regulator n=1 Tax=Lutimaribacter marinistellae TaxID=1820329 RepID=A0ABV7THQ1_9RHOB